MFTFEEYSKRYSRIVFERRSGVIEMRVHTNGGPLQWSDTIHTELVEAFHCVGQDTENRVVILTGTGNSFCNSVEPGSFKFDPSVPPVALDQVYREGKGFITNLLNIRVPVIAAVNGPVTAHSELTLFNDIILAADTTIFQDNHMTYGIVPGDGIHVAYPIAFGMNRGRYLALTGAVVTAQQALDWGAVAEVMPLDKLRDRAWELALGLAQKPILALRYTREILTREIQRQLHDNLGIGLALEGFASGYGIWGHSSLHDAKQDI
jgi:enoyl-CoA hydratase/carnithine racemase